MRIQVLMKFGLAAILATGLLFAQPAAPQTGEPATAQATKPRAPVVEEEEPVKPPKGGAPVVEEEEPVKPPKGGAPVVEEEAPVASGRPSAAHGNQFVDASPSEELYCLNIDWFGV